MISTTRLIDILGGRDVVGGEIRNGIDVARLVRRGLPIASVEHILESGRLSAVEFHRIVMPRTALATRRRVGRLTKQQSDRLLRIVRVMAVAEETFGNREKAAAWLRRHTTALAGERPLDLLDTGEGAREVEKLLGRIGHGIAA